MDWFKRLVRKPVIGAVDGRSSRIAGWAYDPLSGRPVRVDFYVDGRRVGHTIADQYRADLVHVTPDGRCAFEYVLPEKFLDGEVHAVEVRAHRAREPLPHGRFTARLLSQHYYAGMVRWMLRSGFWALFGEIRNGWVHIGGGYIPAPGNEDGRVTVNGQPAVLKLGEGISAWKSPLPPQTIMHTFAAVHMIDPRWNELHFSFGLDRPFNPLHDYHYPLFDTAMPEPERRMRVAGHESEFVFDLEGYSIAKKLDMLAQRFAGKPLNGLGPVLDWGCGCGRTGRFVARNGADFYGVDIDDDNVRWCAAHVKGTFATVSPDPPTAFADNFFGSIYGISVFTHLSQHHEALWLAELHRIAKPGALLFLSVLGSVAAARENRLEHVAADGAGFIDVGRNPGIDAVTQGSDYYRNVFHQPGYIARVWGKYFEILAVEEGSVGNNQDLVVARKPHS